VEQENANFLGIVPVYLRLAASLAVLSLSLPPLPVCYTTVYSIQYKARIIPQPNVMPALLGLIPPVPPPSFPLPEVTRGQSPDLPVPWLESHQLLSRPCHPVLGPQQARFQAVLLIRPPPLYW
jgi:hypothetical protein